MLLFYLFVVVLALPPVWLFARTKPVTDRVVALRRANALAWFATLFAGSCAWIYTSSLGDRSPLVAVVAGVAVGSVVLMLAALLRFFAFRKPRTEG